MDNWNLTKNWMDFGDLDLIFKVTVVEKLKIQGGGTSVFSENIVTSFTSCLIFYAKPHLQKGFILK